ncbi:AraC family transcriptional regulator [Pararobbsia silviterrae]|uniref:AraC family transcriptional regulator n=1 Tax=Pararobbsia silviterrae TaxID=1792498 RepID=A0A494XUR0_9BURK|nr:AraC family transcriptional regulator [Pararobbsia silviterrae]RKP53584.1 AraC family transcriptional regulator [Pararobbsia silviterrae]
MKPQIERIVHWLLSGLELQSTVFHVGQYCGRWQASTSDKGLASFHVVLHGHCWFKRPDTGECTRLEAGDTVFLLRDVPHVLSPDAEMPAADAPIQRIGTMTPLTASTVVGTGLACGFFAFDAMPGELLLSMLPDTLIVRSSSPSSESARAVFDLIRAEALRDSETPSALIARLTELLFFYALREIAERDDTAAGLWSLLKGSEFSSLVEAIIAEPGHAWSTDAMAAHAHMSRARFFKRFVEACGQPPAQFLTLIRMKMAAGMLREGVSISRAAERVGYQSESAFAQAFKRVTGAQPGALRRMPSSSLVH